MRHRVGLTLFGVAWTVAGALMAFNPPPHDLHRGSGTPLLGWLLMVAGVYVVIKAVRRYGMPSGGSAQHDSRRETSARDGIKFVLAAGVLLAAGGLAAWSGFASGQLSLVGVGLACLALGVGCVPLAVPLVRWLVRRRR